MRATYRREKGVVREDGRVEEGDEGEEDSAQEELVEVVVPRIKAVAEDVIPLAYTKPSPQNPKPKTQTHSPRNKFHSEPASPDCWLNASVARR